MTHDRTDTSSPLRDAGPVQLAFEREVMTASEAADFLRLSEDAFKKLAPSLPRCRIYERGGYRYLKEDLLAWLREKSEPCNRGATPLHSGALGGTKTKKSPPVRGVKRLI
jgi:hypothetical protein